jgi:hypothetical protein
LEDDGKNGRRDGKVHDEGVEYPDMLVINVARPASDIAQCHAEKDRNQ